MKRIKKLDKIKENSTFENHFRENNILDFKLIFKNVSFYYEDNQEFPILEDINFEINNGDFISIIGPNGSGKTTLAKLILRIIKPTKGEIYFLINNNKYEKFNIGYVPQYIIFDPLYPITPFEIIISARLRNKFPFFYTKKDKEIVLSIMDDLKITNISNTLFQNLSGGQKQKVLIARALASGSDFLILDEPTSNLDRETQKFIYEKLQLLKKDKTIILISHDISFVPEISTKIFCLNRNLIIHKNENNFNKSIYSNIYNCSFKKVDHNTIEK
jgi:zinc transport system ATP-binding protein